MDGRVRGESEQRRESGRGGCLGEPTQFLCRRGCAESIDGTGVAHRRHGWLGFVDRGQAAFLLVGSQSWSDGGQVCQRLETTEHRRVPDLDAARTDQLTHDRIEPEVNGGDSWTAKAVATGEVKPFFKGLEPVEAVVIRHRETGQDILLVHGHQVDSPNVWEENAATQLPL